jgi:hypothetical protein
VENNPAREPLSDQQMGSAFIGVAVPDAPKPWCGGV